eukprot:m.130029 g.130029  ORF g.130029 m.130029 type:complete len:199 (+) comp38009_c1_seq3:481-1077(+)
MCASALFLVVTTLSAIEWESREYSNFANGNKVTKLTDSIKTMFEFFDRPCLIIEKDRDKGKATGRNHQRSHHLDHSLATLIQTSMKVLFSDNSVMTALLLMELAQVEKAKKADIQPLPDGINQDASNPMFKFLLSIPKISFITAASLYYSFASLGELVKSSSSELMQRTRNLSKQRADAIVDYFTYQFDSSMLPLPGR